jgi:hypothetical protein
LPSIEGDRLPQRFDELSGFGPAGKATTRGTWDAFFALARIPIAGLGRKDVDELRILAGLFERSTIALSLDRTFGRRGKAPESFACTLLYRAKWRWIRHEPVSFQAPGGSIDPGRAPRLEAEAATAPLIAVLLETKPRELAIRLGPSGD